MNRSICKHHQSRVLLKQVITENSRHTVSVGILTELSLSVMNFVEITHVHYYTKKQCL